jgi:cysteinyl-tRNA synthetase
MSVQIYNTLTRKKEELKKRLVKMYTCGVTVYDFCHIGHARSLYIFDIIRRYLNYRGYKVQFIRNITDIDDKIINKAKELGISARELADRYTKSYYEDIDALGINKADKEPKATENISDMIKHINGLIKKGYAYLIDGDIYFSVRRFKDYGKLSGQNLEQMMTAVRIQKDEKKQDPLDFVLWKRFKDGEPSWGSPWGQGRPGWHIECSVMSLKYLKTKTLDIHGGGRDLIFPHHENEIAQSEALTGRQFVKLWIHHGLLTVNGQKMAKSLGNFITIQEFISKYPSDVLKLFFLQTHYSQPIDFTWPKMEEKRKALYRITSFLKSVREREKGKESIIRTKFAKIISPEELLNKVRQFCKEFEEFMDDDFNTPNAIAVLFEIVRNCERILFDASYTERYLTALTYARKAIEKFGNIFGFSFEEGPLSLPEEDIEILIRTRQKFREQKDFSSADKIRKELEDKGIILEDTKEGTTWRRKL